MKEQEMHDGTINGSHFVTVGKTKEVAKDSIESLLAPYNVPEEVINMLKSQQVAELETPKNPIALLIEAATTHEISAENRKYRGYEKDGYASDFLIKMYKKELNEGILNTSNLQAADEPLFIALRSEISNHNKRNPHDKKSLSDFLLVKEDVLKMQEKTVLEVIPKEYLSDILSLLRSVERKVTYGAKKGGYSM